MKKFAAIAAVLCMCAGALGATPAGAATFSNPAPITIAFSGTANPYPSNISVTGLGPSVADVNATLSGFNHTFPVDTDVLLVSPTGQSVVLMSDVPGGFPYCGNDVVGVNLTFDDAAGPIPPEATLASGTYQPTDNASTASGCGFDDDPFAGPAPGGPYGSTLAVFNGTNPNGVWSLYVVDDAGGDSGSLASGWSIDIEAPAPAPAPAPAAVAAAPTCKGKQATIVGTGSSELLKGTSGKDVIVGLGGNDKLSGLGGNDLICGGAGKDTLKGGQGNDKLLGQKGNDTLKGGPGKDNLKGGAGKDKQIQ